MTRSSFAWLAHDDAEAEQLRRVVEAFGDKGTLDPIGFGPICDAVADLLFPGISTIQTVPATSSCAAHLPGFCLVKPSTGPSDTSGMPDPLDPAEPGHALRVRYYPRRVEDPGAPAALTPSQALHLQRDPARADRARRTADAQHFDAPSPRRPGLVRRLLDRLRSR